MGRKIIHPARLLKSGWVQLLPVVAALIFERAEVIRIIRFFTIDLPAYVCEQAAILHQKEGLRPGIAGERIIRGNHELHFASDASALPGINVDSIHITVRVEEIADPVALATVGGFLREIDFMLHNAEAVDREYILLPVNCNRIEVIFLDEIRSNLVRVLDVNRILSILYTFAVQISLFSGVPQNEGGIVLQQYGIIQFFYRAEISVVFRQPITMGIVAGILQE